MVFGLERKEDGTTEYQGKCSKTHPKMCDRWFYTVFVPAAVRVVWWWWGRRGVGMASLGPLHVHALPTPTQLTTTLQTPNTNTKHNRRTRRSARGRRAFSRPSSRACRARRRATRTRWRPRFVCD